MSITQRINSWISLLGLYDNSLSEAQAEELKKYFWVNLDKEVE